MPDKKMRFGILGTGLGGVFLGLSILVNRASFTGIDHTILTALQATIGRRYHALLSASSFIGSPESTLFVVCLVFAYIYLRRRRAPLSLVLFFALFAVEFWGKSVLFHPDPPSLVSRLGSSPATGPHVAGSIVKSAFVCAALLVAVVLAYILATRRRLWISLSALIALIVVGVGAIVFVFHPGLVWHVGHSPVLYPLHSLLARMESSFPSGHMARTTFVCVILLALWDTRQPIGRTQKMLGTLLAVLFVAAMSVSLISLGYHWFSDVLGGLALGASFASFALCVDDLEGKTSTPEAIRTPAPGSGGRCSIH